MIPNSHTHMNDVLGAALENQDTFGGPQGVRITQGLLFYPSFRELDSFILQLCYFHKPISLCTVYPPT
jgi:hypothetical protein